jgi:hypothetical protein
VIAERVAVLDWSSLAAEVTTAASAPDRYGCRKLTAPGQQIDQAIAFARQIAAAAPLGVRTLLVSAHSGISEKLALATLSRFLFNC